MRKLPEIYAYLWIGVREFMRKYGRGTQNTEHRTENREQRTENREQGTGVRGQKTTLLSFSVERRRSGIFWIPRLPLRGRRGIQAGGIAVCRAAMFSEQHACD